MSEEIDGVASTDATEQYAIGISFGNSNSSIAHLSGVRSPLLETALPIYMLTAEPDRMGK